MKFKPLFLNLDEASGLARCSKDKLKKEIRENRLSAYKPGKELLITCNDLSRWLQAQTVTPLIDDSLKSPINVGRVLSVSPSDVAPSPFFKINQAKV